MIVMTEVSLLIAIFSNIVCARGPLYIYIFFFPNNHYYDYINYINKLSYCGMKSKKKIKRKSLHPIFNKYFTNCVTFTMNNNIIFTG